MTKVKVLNAQDVSHLVDMPTMIDVVQDAYQEKAAKTGEIWPMVYHAFSDMADMDIRSGVLQPKHIFGNKLLAWFGNNAQRNLPELNGLVTLYSSETGEPVGIINAPALTGYRTGAAGAVASRVLANPHSNTLLMVGAGSQALYQIMAQLCVLPEISTVEVYDPMSNENAKSFAAEAEGRLVELFSQKIQENIPAMAVKLEKRLSTVRFMAVDDLAMAVKKAQVIVTATPSTKPLIKVEWVQPGTHINAIGADMAGKQELDTAIFAHANAYVDDLEQATTVGETQNPVKDGTLKRDNIHEIGTVLTKQVSGRQNTKEITVFDSTGIALQDLEAANLALQRATEYHVGTTIEL
jgi:alanine dehydrogenase